MAVTGLALFGHAVHAFVAFVTMIALTIIEGLMLLFSRGESVVPGLPTLEEFLAAGAAAEAAGKKPPAGGKRFPMTILRAEELGPDTLSKYVKRSEPVIIKGVDAKLFNSSLAEYAPEETPEQVAKGVPNLHINFWLLPSVGGAGAWINKHLPWKPILYMARFSGAYKAGYAHIDTFPSYNFYYVRRGRKRVILVPRQYNDAVNLKGGYDSNFVGDDAPDMSKLEWIDRLPGVWEFELEAGDVLLFNNSACIHKFMNLTHNPEIFTIRLLHDDASPYTYRNDLLNWEGAKYVAYVLWNGLTSTQGTNRDTASIDKQAKFE